MTRTFRADGDRVRATFAPFEVDLLRSLHDQLDDALERSDPDDPIVRRLFPPPVLGEDADDDLQALLAMELLTHRREGLAAFVALLDRGREHRGRVRVDLTDDEPLLVLGVLNDVRLAIGASVDVEALDRGDIAEDDPVAYRLAVMDHLAWMQEQLLAIVDPPSVTHGGGELDHPTD